MSFYTFERYLSFTVFLFTATATQR